MPKDIAVYIGENGETASLYEKGTVVVYQKKQQEWHVLREKEFVPESSMTMNHLREKMNEVVDFLQSCKIFVGQSVVGIPYFELEKSQCSVWEFQGKPLDFLDYVLTKEEEALEEESRLQERVLLAPVEISNGCFTFSLKEIQAGEMGITSKQALLPFLKKADFYSLEIICNHVPPWLEAEFAGGSLCGEIKRLNNDEIKIIVTKKTCHQRQ